MKHTKHLLNLMAVTAVMAFTSCSSDDNGGNGGPGEGDPVASKYVVTASSGENDYIVSGDQWDPATVYDATSPGAVQSPGDRIWSFYKDQVLYGFLYNQADAGTTASYVLNPDGSINKRNELALNVSIHVREEIGDKLILAYSDRLRTPEVDQLAYFYEVDPATDASKEFKLVTNDLLEDGEIAYFTDLASYGGKIIAGARSVSASSFASAHYNNTYVVVLNDDFTVDQVIKDSGRTGFVAGQKLSQGDTGLEVVDNGDLYVFSSAQTNYADADSQNIPSGILKIDKGDFAFDQDYFFNITEASGGFNLFRAYYMGGTTFVLSMYPGTNSEATFGIDADRFAVVDVATKDFKWVTNFPEDALQGWEFRTPYLDRGNQRLIVTASPGGNEHYLYAIDPATASATRLSEVIGESVKVIGKLNAQEQ